VPADPKAVDGRVETARFSDLGYDDFRRMARDPTLGANERIGMPDALRSPFDAPILADVRTKLPALDERGRTVIDIGCGCSTFTRLLIEHARAHEHTLVLVDSPEMLEALAPSTPAVCVPGRFPHNASAVAEAAGGAADVVLAYGVLSIVFFEANPFAFVERAAALLRPGGRLLIGDIPNHSKLRRFLASDAGARFHAEYMRTSEPPHVAAFDTPSERIDDGVVFGIAQRLRGGGYDAYVVPQSDALPLANRREDLLIVRP
jgi:2-polyprenyl-3-methyl-5-hydroxy-6-metoxy-1,4-benzoquinol methylase